MNIYKLKRDTADLDLENQYIIETKVNYALTAGYDHVEDIKGRLFKLGEEEDCLTLTEVTKDEDEEDENECKSEDELISLQAGLNRLTTPELIEFTIRDMLLEETITLEQAKTMVVLEQLKQILDNE